MLSWAAIMTRRLRFLALLWIAVLSAFAQRPYVVLVSLDGFRYDYAEKYAATHLLDLAKAGASAELIPSYPSITFPNHISIVTGMYPEHHGIVANTFFDPARKQEYSMRQAPTEGDWLQAKPLWVIAEEQKVKAATMFWPMSDAEIGGVRPSYRYKYDGSVPDEERVARVEGWLKLPEKDRPHFITLYFSDTDSAGHRFGPDSPEEAAAVHHVDTLIGGLWKDIQALSLPVDLIVVSDHGMQSTQGFVNLGDYADLSKVRVENSGAFALIYAPDHATAEQTYLALKGKSPKFDVYRRAEVPAGLHYSDNERIGDLVVIAREPVILMTQKPTQDLEKGEHGYDPAQFRTMHGIFYRAGARPEPFVNVEIVPFIAKILGLSVPRGLDGTGKALEGALQH
jgi:alkaline phosphatase D